MKNEKPTKSKKKTLGIIALVIVGIVVASLIFGDDAEKAANSVQNQVTETVQQTDTTEQKSEDTQPAQQESSQPDNSLEQTAVATCKAYTESQVYVAPASADLVSIDKNTSEITVMATVKDTAGEYFAWCVLSPSGREVKNFRVGE